MTVQTFTPAGQVTGIPDGAAMLAAWAQTATSAAQLVGPLVETAFVPDHFRPKIDPRATEEEKNHARQVAIASATAAVLYGAEIGLSPMQALQGVLVIKGKVGMYAATMVALVQAAGHEVWTEDSTDTRVIVCGRRSGTQAIERQVWDIDRARKAGYLSNEKYKTDPQAMLWARAASVVCRRIAQDVLKGITASSEEIVDEDARTAPRSGTRTVTRAPASPPLVDRDALAAGLLAREARASVALDRDQTHTYTPAAPPLPGEDQADTDTPQGPAEDGPIDQRQWRAINAAFVRINSHGVTGPGQDKTRLAVLTALLGRTITRGGDLTRAEAQTVLDTLTANGGAAVAEILTPARGHLEQATDQQPADDDQDVYDPTTEADWAADEAGA